MERVSTEEFEASGQRKTASITYWPDEGATPLQEGDTLTFTDGRSYRVGQVTPDPAGGESAPLSPLDTSDDEG